jgi:xylan 1,4-beta-xylosidase
MHTSLIRLQHYFRAAVLIVPFAAASLAPAQDQFREFHVDAARTIGTIRSFQGVVAGPLPVLPGGPDLSKQYKDLRIDLIRTHDIYGPTEIDSHFREQSLGALISDPAKRAAFAATANGAVIFPDAKADPGNPRSYNFGPTDKLIQAIRDTGADVYYRVGRSLQADPVPVSDPDKYAEILKHVVMHYNKGWANGYRNSVRYWEFWDEPEFRNFWPGTPSELYSLYEKSARAVKSIDTQSKFGAIGKAFAHTPGPFREEFLDYVTTHKVPLDFYSWHWYASYSADPWDVITQGKEIRDLLDSKGLRTVESHMAEWNLSPDTTERSRAIHESMTNAAFTAAAMIYMQDAPIDRAMLYRGDSVWIGLFNTAGQPLKKYYAFRAAGNMLETPGRLAVSGTGSNGFTALAGRSRDGKTVQVLIGNYEIMNDVSPLHPTVIAGTEVAVRLPRREVEYKDNKGYALALEHLPWGKKGYTLTRYRLDETHNLSPVEETSGTGTSVEISNPLSAPGVELIVLRSK